MTHADIDTAAEHLAHALPEGAIGSLAWIGELVRLAHLGLDADRPSLDELAEYRPSLAPGMDLDKPHEHAF